MIMKDRNWLPSFLKPIIRLLVYPQERAKFLREPKIKRAQDELIKQYPKNTKKLVVFLIQGADYDSGVDKITGGTISIVSLCEKSAKLKSVHQAEVLLCTFPGQHLLLKHVQFLNNTTVFRYEQLASYFTDAEEVLFHIPEYLCDHFILLGKANTWSWLKQLRKVHINILNQNIRLMPEPERLKVLHVYVTEITITTAHQQYCNQYYRDLYQVPLHKFSVWISPEKYFFKDFKDKSELMVVSPDFHPLKQVILEKIERETGVQVKVIQNLTYEQYKELIAKAKWALTFGEGLDGYFIEPVFSGAISFAVFNKDFFTKDFKELPTLYDSVDQLMLEICTDILEYNNDRIKFDVTQKEQFDLCAKYYSAQTYSENIIKFYNSDFSFK